MKYHSKKILSSAPAFSLVEAVTALIILSLVSSSVLIVINRCMASSIDSESRMQAFEVARGNMEAILFKDKVEEMTEYGSSDKYPEIKWQTVIETFYEPVTQKMWARAICSAKYVDMAGDEQAIELTNWLTNLTKEQVIQMIEEKKKEKEQSAEGVIAGDANQPYGQGYGEMICGYTREEIKQMSIEELYQLLSNCDEF